MEGRLFIRRRLLRMRTSTPRARSGLIALLCLLAAAPIPAQSGKKGAATGGSGPEEPLAVLVTVSPERPSVDSALVVTLLVEYPDPTRAEVRAPTLPRGVTLERVRSEPRLVRGGDRDERWTAIEFTFSVAEEGEFAFDPFRVEVPEKRGSTPPLTIRVSGPGGVSRPPVPRRSLAWERVPSTLRAGVAAEVLLVMAGGPAGEATISADAPEGALMESLALSEEDRARGVVARFRLTALQAPGFRLPAVVVAPAGESSLRAEAGWIAVTPGPAQEARGGRPAAAPASAPAEPAKADLKPPFPAIPRFIAPLRAPAERTIALARTAWETEDYARALAVLWGAHGDARAGIGRGRVGGAAERSLGLMNTPDEAYAPWSLSALVACVCLLACVLAFFSKRRVTSGKRRGYTVAIFFLLLAALSVGHRAAVRLDAAGYLGRGIAAVSPACPVFRIPEKEGGVAAEFAAGQPVRLRSSAGTWQYAEAPDGQAGWVEGDRMIRY